MAEHDPLLLFFPKEAADKLRTNERTMERWRNQGTGPQSVRVGRRVAFRAKDLSDYLDRQTRTHTNDEALGR